MGLGVEPGGDDNARRYRQTRMRYLIACLVCTTVLGAVIAGAIVAVNGAASLSDEGLVVGVAGVFALLAASVVIPSVKPVHWRKRVRQRLEAVVAAVAAGEIAPAADTWVPPGSGEATHD